MSEYEIKFLFCLLAREMEVQNNPKVGMLSFQHLLLFYSPHLCKCAWGGVLKGPPLPPLLGL